MGKTHIRPKRQISRRNVSARTGLPKRTKEEEGEKKLGYEGKSRVCSNNMQEKNIHNY